MSDAQPGGAVSAAEALERINQAWLGGTPQALGPLFHPEITMAFPDFAGRAIGRDAMLAGFVDFCENAKIRSYQESDRQVDVIGDTAVASFEFEMVYEREGQAYRSMGRDLWVFARGDSGWVAVWRTMLDIREEPA